MSLKVTAVYTFAGLSSMKIPIATARIPAGEPKGVENSSDQFVDFNKYLIRNPGDTFGVYVEGDSMIDDHIYDGDLLVVDRCIEPASGDIAIVAVDDELTVKKLSMVGKRLWLIPGNKDYKKREVTSKQDCSVWGVATYVIHKLR